MEKRKDEIESSRNAFVGVIFYVAVLFALLLVGCASYVIKDGDGKIISSGQASGFLRTITVTESFENGVIKERKISTDSTTKDVLMGLNEFVDTAIETGAKLKP